MGRQNILNRMVASILQVYSALNFFMNADLIYYCCFQIPELCHIHMFCLALYSNFTVNKSQHNLLYFSVDAAPIANVLDKRLKQMCLFLPLGN
jgi:hypothetical protein